MEKISGKRVFWLVIMAEFVIFPILVFLFILVYPANPMNTGALLQPLFSDIKSVCIYYYYKEIEEGEVEKMPFLGTFERDSPEGKNIADVGLLRIKPLKYKEKDVNYLIIASMDFETGRLYAGLTEISFLQNRLSKREIRNIKNVFENNPKVTRNAKGEPYIAGGDTILYFVKTLSSEDVEVIRSQMSQSNSGEGE